MHLFPLMNVQGIQPSLFYFHSQKNLTKYFPFSLSLEDGYVLSPVHFSLRSFVFHVRPHCPSVVWCEGHMLLHKSNMALLPCSVVIMSDIKFHK